MQGIIKHLNCPQMLRKSLRWYDYRGAALQVGFKSIEIIYSL